MIKVCNLTTFRIKFDDNLIFNVDESEDDEEAPSYRPKRIAECKHVGSRQVRSKQIFFESLDDEDKAGLAEYICTKCKEALDHEKLYYYCSRCGKNYCCLDCGGKR